LINTSGFVFDHVSHPNHDELGKPVRRISPGGRLIHMRVEQPGGPAAVTVDIFHPAYQVTIFEPLDEPADLPHEERSVMANEWKIYDAEVTEVLEWAKDNAGANQYVVEVATPQAGGSAKLLRLFGNDPTWGEAVSDSVYQYVPGVSPDQM